MGQRIGTLTVLERSDQYATRGKRKVQLWKCQCDCGVITYKATDTLTNEAKSMCKTCAATYAISKARAGAGFVEGTQVSKLRVDGEKANNATGVKGVYLEAKTGRYRARIKFQGKMYSLGTYSTLEEAAKARRKGEQEIFGAFLESQEQKF